MSIPLNLINTGTLPTEYQHHSAEHASSDAWILPAIKKELKNLPQGSVIADLGCGNGSLLAEFRRRGFELHGFDSSSSGLTQGRKAYPEIRFTQADLGTDLPGSFLVESCDVIISTEVVEHVFLPRFFAANCYKLLKPGGKVILSAPYHGYLKNLALAVTGKMDSHFTVLWDFGHIKFWSRRTLTFLLEEAGFTVEQFYGVGRVPYLWKSMIITAKK